MSSRLRKSLLNASIFRRALLISGGALMVALLAIWAYAYIPWSNAERTAKTAIDAEYQLIVSTLDAHGLNNLIATLDYEDGPVWNDEQVFAIRDSNDFVIRVLDDEEDTLAGFPNLEADFGWGHDYVWLHEFDTVFRVFVRRAELSDDVSVAVAKIIDQDVIEVVEHAQTVSIGLIVFWIPTALILAVSLSRYNYRRLGETAKVADRVGHARLDLRAPTEKDDEYARFNLIINEMLDRNEVLARNLETVSIGVAHDLRTPISNLGGRLQLIERDLDNPDAIMKHVRASQDHMDALLRTLEALLRLGDVEAGKRKAVFSPVILSALATELVESLEPIFADADKTLTVDIAPILSVIGDGDLLTQMLINLLENVLDHGRDGAQAWLHIKARGERISIIVGDDGPGIPTSRTEQVFERFFRVDSSRNTPGNGLGLSLVKAISELHGGGVELVKSNPGAEFEIMLPISL